MHGQLSARSIADVCRELADVSATGVLHIAGTDAAGRLVFDQGRLVAATSPTPGSRLGDRLVNGGLLQEETLNRVLDEQNLTPPEERSRLGQLLVDRGLVPIDAVRLVVQEQLLDAVFDLTGWREGTYRFEADAEPDSPEVPLAVPVDQALVEIARRREEWAALTEVIPDLDAVPRFREGATTSTADLEPDEFAVMASVDGLRSVRDLAYDLGYGEFEAARIVYGLALLGLVEVVPPIDEIGAALDDALAYVGEDASDGDDGGPSAWPAASGTATEPASGPAADQSGAEALAQAVAAFDLDEPATVEAPESRGAPDAADGDHARPVERDDAAPVPDRSGSQAVEEPEPWTSWDEAVTRPEREPAVGDAAAPSADRPWSDPEQEPWPDMAPESSSARDEETLEADLPRLSGYEELRLADRHEQPAPSAPEPAEPAPAPEVTAEAGGPDPEAGPPTPRRAMSQSDGDVSEFLRELSRLALDDEAPSEADEPTEPAEPDAPSPRPPPPPRRPPPTPREEPRRKKRGLFGFGG